MNNTYILSVEDNSADRALMARVFKKELPTYPVEFIEDGESAIQFFETPKFKENPPKCILLDIKLPKMNGLEVLNYLRNIKEIKNVPVVMLSSSNRADEIKEMYTLGGNSYIEKPKSLQELKTKLPVIVEYWVNHNK